MNAVDLPDELVWIVEQLEQRTAQDWKEFQTDSGIPLRRAASSPYKVLAGKVDVDEPTWEIINSLPLSAIYRTKDPLHEGKQLHFVVRKVHEARIAIMSGGPTIRTLDIELRVV